MIDAEVDIEHGVAISATSMEKAIYCKAPYKISGGTPQSGDYFKYTRGEYDENGNVVTVDAVISEIRGEHGERYYDHAIVGEDGNIETHVTFSK